MKSASNPMVASNLNVVSKRESDELKLVDNLWIIIPAAGIGRRMGAPVPKQYLEIDDQTILSLTISRLFSVFPKATFVVGIAEADVWWPKVLPQLPCSVLTSPGAARRDLTVINALNTARESGAKTTDWVMVHDAVRPCVPVSDLHDLWRTAWNTGDAALLGVPVVDSIRRVTSENVLVEAVSREHLWRVFTPQVFSFAVLETAMTQSVKSQAVVSDESEAVLAAGYEVRAVLGSEENFKMTYPEDLQRVAAVLHQQHLNESA